MSTIKTISAGVERAVDPLTGEVLSEKALTRDILVKDSEEWFICYRNLMKAVLNLNSNEVRVLLWCAINTTVNTNEIVLARYIKDRMSAEIKIGIPSIDNALSSLVKKELMRRLARGVFHIDPANTWKGDLKTRARNITVYLNYKVEQP